MSGDVVNYLLQFLGFYILVIGITGNSLSLAVLCRKSLRTSKIGPYLIVLSLADNFALTIFVTFEILKLYNISLDTLPLLLCKMINFFLALASQCSSWLTVIITVERMVCICRPLTSLRRSVRPRTVVSTMILVLAVLDLVYASFFVVKNGKCEPLWNQQMLILTVTYSYIPALILVVCNSVIVYKIYHRPVLGQTQSARRASSNTIRVVIAINLVFLVTTLPVSLQINIAVEIFHRSLILADFFSCLNNASNFLLYMIFSKPFRKELLRLFRKKEQSRIYTVPDTSK